jgi:small GTP-binding protein
VRHKYRYISKIKGLHALPSRPRRRITLSSEPRRRQFKICLIGDGFVGKTSIRLKYLKGGFKRNYIPTLGVDFAQKLIQHDGVPTNLVIWDIAGQSLFANLRKRYYDGASGIILVYSVIDKTAFANARTWLEEAAGYVKKLPPLIIVGNKIDLRDETPQDEIVTTHEGRDFALNISNILGTRSVFIETSALTGENIDRAFEGLVDLMLEEFKKRDSSYVPETSTPEAAPSTLIDLSKSDATVVEEAVSEDSVASEPIVEEPMSEEAKVSEDTMAESVQADAGESEVSETTTHESLVEEITSAYESAVAESKSEEVLPEQEVVTTEKTVVIDPVTTLPSDSEYMHEEQIGSAMGNLVRLREELRVAEEGLAGVMSEIETELLNLKNVIHVKKIMYSHLQEQLKTTRQEWSDAYEKYLESEQRKTKEMEERSKQIDALRKEIDNIGKKIRSRVGDLDMKKISD